MKFFIRVCLAFHHRLAVEAPAAPIKLAEFLRAFGQVAERLGDNEGDEFPDCMPEHAGYGSYAYPHERIVRRFHEACGNDCEMPLQANVLWRRLTTRLISRYETSQPVRQFVDELWAELGVC